MAGWKGYRRAGKRIERPCRTEEREMNAPHIYMQRIETHLKQIVNGVLTDGQEKKKGFMTGGRTPHRFKDERLLALNKP
jgi:hypothetical protein